MIEFTFRHLRRNWRTSLAVLGCMTLASALLVGFAGYTETVAVQELNQTLDQVGPAERSLLITGPRFTFSDELYALLQQALGDVLEDRMVIRHATSPAEQPTPEGTGERQAVDLLEVYSFDNLSENVRVLEGSLPGQVRLREATEYWRPPPMEAVLGIQAAEEFGYGVGDRLVGSGGYHRLDIVGIVEPLDPQADIWGEDLSAFAIYTDDMSPGADLTALPVIIAPGSMRSSYPEQPVFLHQVSWRITLNRQLVNSTRAETLLADLINLRTQSATRSATIATDLINILAGYLARLSRVRMAFYLLTAQTLLFVLYTLTVFASFAVEHSRDELAALSARGASPWQMARVSALENLILALPAGLLLGPGLAYGAIRLWGGATREVVLRTLPGEAWVLSGVAIGLGWLALVLPVLLLARRKSFQWQPTRDASPGQLAAQKHYLDLYLLGFGALLYWQLNRSGSFVMRRLRDTQFADPILLLGPSLLLVAIALVSLRLLPLLLQLVTRAMQRARGLVITLGVFRLTRDSAPPSRVVLLVGLTAGLLLFTTTFGSSLAHSQQEMARYLAGADVRIALNQPHDLPLDEVSALSGVRNSSPAVRGVVGMGDGQTISLLAVDAGKLARVTSYPSGLSTVTIADLMRTLESEATAAEINSEVLPAVFSSPALPAGVTTGDQLSLQFGGTLLVATVGAIIDDFPTLSGPFVVINLADLEARVGPETLSSSASREAWLATEHDSVESLKSTPILQGRVLDDSQTRLRALQSDALTTGIHHAFRLNALTVVVFSVTAFCLNHFVAAQGREREFRTLRVMGLTARQMIGLVVTEGMSSLFLGLLVGTGLGLGLSYIMIPFLSQPLAESLAGAAIEQIVVDWPAIARLDVQMIVIYGAALAVMMLALVRTRLSRVPWAEE